MASSAEQQTEEVTKASLKKQVGESYSILKPKGKVDLGTRLQMEANLWDLSRNLDLFVKEPSKIST